MLKTIRSKKTSRGGGHFAIVASQYNGRYVDGMLRAAEAELRRAKVASIQVVRVPGAFEIPVVAARLARASARRPDAIICLGVILRGETSHAQHIAEGVTHALARLQVETGVPIIHEVLLFENEQQARVRCLSRKHNRGREAAHTAVRMARVMEGLGE